MKKLLFIIMLLPFLIFSQEEQLTSTKPIVVNKAETIEIGNYLGVDINVLVLSILNEKEKKKQVEINVSSGTGYSVNRATNYIEYVELEDIISNLDYFYKLSLTTPPANRVVYTITTKNNCNFSLLSSENKWKFSVLVYNKSGTHSNSFSDAKYIQDMVYFLKNAKAKIDSIN